MSRVDNEQRRELEKALGLHPLVAHLLLQRGVGDPVSGYRFLNPSLDHLYPPESMADLELAGELIKGAVSKGKRILIYGDYDVDGITGSVLLYELVRVLGGKVEVFIPDRNRHGYGLTEAGIKEALERFSPDLLITVDCGIRAVPEVNWLNEQGIETIITDHHLPGDVLPPARAILNPKRPDCSYPYKDLSGVGVAYTLARYLLNSSEDFLDLTALGTVADVVPLLGENRVIVHYGMPKIEKGQRAGIKALMECARLSKVSVRSIGFVLGPRLNSAGRVSTAIDSFNLLICPDYNRAKELAEELNQHNRYRQEIQEEIMSMVEEVAQEQVESGRKVLVVWGRDWHSGVVGIVASRLVDKFGLPAIVIGFDGPVGKGSARSIDGFDITSAMAMCSEHLLAFGGHKLAGGLSIREVDVEAFADSINRIADSLITDRRPMLRLDGRLRLDMLNFSLIEQMQSLGPFGEGNPMPTFLFPNLSLRSEVKQMARDTIKFWVEGNGVSIPIVGFRMGWGKEEIESAKVLDIVARPTISAFDGWEEAQLELVDWRVRE